jgi:MGT family glycosyltransferase
MSTILFIMLPEAGHINSTLKLCKQLKNRGHRVVQVGIPDMEEFATGHGIEFFPVGEKYVPKGFLPQKNRDISEKGIIERLKFLRDYIERVKKFLKELHLHEFNALLKQLQPDLFIVDALLPFASIAAASSKVPVLSLSTTMPAEFNPQLPPLGSNCIPSPGRRGSARVAWQWALRSAEALFWQTLASMAGFNLWHEIKEQAALWNFPKEKIQYIASFLPYIQMDELVLCAREFDFPHAGRKNRYYIGPMVDLERQEADFPWEKIDPSRPLIYCSFGTQAFWSRETRVVMQNIIDAAGGHPEWQLVMATGTQMAAESFARVKSNVFLLSYAPQMALLDKAALFISHGGLNSIKEAIMARVPLVVIPLTRDQPGNAGRVAYHRLGVACSPRKANKNTMETMIDNVFHDGEIKKNINRMSDIFYETESKEIGSRIIEEYIAKGFFEKTAAW